MALLGRNGAGKSTTMKAIMGLASRPARQRDSAAAASVSGLKPHHIARAGLGFVPEDRQIFPGAYGGGLSGHRRQEGPQWRG